MSIKIIRRDALPPVRKVELADLGSAVKPSAPPGPSAAPAASTTPAVVLSGADPEAFARAHEQGYREGLEAARVTAEAERSQLQALIAGIGELLQDFEQTLANDVLSMSLELSKQIVRQSLRVRPELVLAVVREAISSLPGLNEQTVLILNPADAELVRKGIQSEPAFGTLPWKIVEDAQVERGGCRIETPTTEVDGALETRWRRVVASLGREDSWIDITT